VKTKKIMILKKNHDLEKGANSAVPATNETRDNATLMSFILPPHATSGDDLAAVRPSVHLAPILPFLCEPSVEYVRPGKRGMPIRPTSVPSQYKKTVESQSRGGDMS